MSKDMDLQARFGCKGGTVTALTFIATCFALILYIHFAVKFMLWLSEVVDTFWYGAGQWVAPLVVVTLTVAPIAILIEVVT
jgi:hypothetical protein